MIPPQVSPIADAAALLRFAAANGFLIAAFMGLVRTTFSDYPKLRAKLGLTLYEESAMRRKLEAAGFTRATRAEKYRPQPGAHDLSRAAALTLTTSCLPLQQSTVAICVGTSHPMHGPVADRLRETVQRFQAWFDSRPGPPTLSFYF